MTQEQRILLIWAAAALVAFIVGGIILSNRAETLASIRNQADQLHERYQRLYGDGVPAPEAKVLLAQRADEQAHALEEANQSLVPLELPRPYQVTQLNDAQAQANKDFASIKQRAERQKIKLPGELPFEQGFDPANDKRSMQLAQLYLCRQVLDLCMDVGVIKVNSIAAQPTLRDASGSYAVVCCDFSLDLPFAAAQRLLLELQAKQGDGFGVRKVELEAGDGMTQHLVSLVVSLITTAKPHWEAQEEAPRRSDGVAPASVPAGGRRRLGGG